MAARRRPLKIKGKRKSILHYVRIYCLRGVILAALFLFIVGQSHTVFLRWFSNVQMHSSPHLSVVFPNESFIGFNVKEAKVDITTKQLYDDIAFENKDGGVWKQGWEVTYRGDEWDKEKLKVFVVPHSHNDPGWLRTVEEYYQERTRSILSTIVQSLVKDKRRKFIWEEMSYLERWWKDASETQKNDFTRLVKNGQLEIVGGGWVMNDEANSHFFAIIEQMIAGNLWLRDVIGVTPKNAWAIDPFGHSSTMAYLLKRMGFKNMLIQRTHYEVKKALAWEHNLEFLWRQSWDSKNTTDIFCHMMPFYSYDIPHTCGPEPAVCCQFDYWRLPRYGGALRCPWGISPEETNSENVQERATKLLDQYKKKSTLYRSNTLLVPLGDDFRYITTVEAELQYNNYQAMFDYINSHPELNAQVSFGTLEDYFTTLRNEAARTASDSSQNTLDVPGFPTLAGDFFTYADRMQDYWSGYYVSRPFYKAVDRVLEETLRASDILLSLTSAYCQGTAKDVLLSFSDKMLSASRNLALFQHHDGVTGTAKNHVVEDYGFRMHNALIDMQKMMASSIGILLSKLYPSGKCAVEYSDFFEPEHTRRTFNMLPEKKTANLGNGMVQRVVAFNSLEESVDQVVTVIVENTNVCVFDLEWVSLESQISPEWSYEGNRLFMGKHRLQWQASIPAMGISTYFIVQPDDLQPCKRASLPKLKVFNQDSSFECPDKYQCIFGNSKTVEIFNRHQTLSFSTDYGLLQWVKVHKNSKVVNIEEEISYYSSQGSGAYLFLPDGEAQALTKQGGLVVVTEGFLMQEVFTLPNSIIGSSPIYRAARMYAGDSVQSFVIEMEYHTDLTSSNCNNKEIISRFKTDVQSNKVFFSDLNGFQTIRRETYEKIPLQGNYYPMPSLAFLQDAGGQRFYVHSRQALGVASLRNGWLEVMLDRKLTHDDARGLEQGVMDNRPNNVLFHLLLESNISSIPLVSSSASRLPSLLSHRIGAQLNYPVHLFYGKPEEVGNVKFAISTSKLRPKASWSSLVEDLPCDLHINNLKYLSFYVSKQLSVSEEQEYGLLLQRRGWDTSYCRKGGNKCRTFDDVRNLDIVNMFNNIAVSNVRQSTLNFVEDDPQQMEYSEQLHRKERIGIPTRKGLLDMDPMELQAFKFYGKS